MEGQNFSKEDDLDEADYNHALWIGLKGKHVPYPTVRDGRDLRQPSAQPAKSGLGRNPRGRSYRQCPGFWPDLHKKRCNSRCLRPPGIYSSGVRILWYFP